MLIRLEEAVEGEGESSSLLRTARAPALPLLPYSSGRPGACLTRLQGAALHGLTRPVPANERVAQHTRHGGGRWREFELRAAAAGTGWRRRTYARARARRPATHAHPLRLAPAPACCSPTPAARSHTARLRAPLAIAPASYCLPPLDTDCLSSLCQCGRSSGQDDARRSCCCCCAVCTELW